MPCRQGQPKKTHASFETGGWSRSCCDVRITPTHDLRDHTLICGHGQAIGVVRPSTSCDKSELLNCAQSICRHQKKRERRRNVVLHILLLFVLLCRFLMTHRVLLPPFSSTFILIQAYLPSWKVRNRAPNSDLTKVRHRRSREKYKHFDRWGRRVHWL